LQAQARTLSRAHALLDLLHHLRNILGDHFAHHCLGSAALFFVVGQGGDACGVVDPPNLHAQFAEEPD
jgi:hypothetical protein